MTRITKKAIWAIVLVVLVLGAVVFILWGSQGGKEWNAAKWFNYWGKGAPITSIVADDQEAAAEKSAANAGLTHDSDLSAAVTAEVKRYDAPTLELTSEGIKITTLGAHGNQVSWSQYLIGDKDQYAGQSGTLTYTGNEALLPFSKFSNGSYSLRFKNVGSGNYLDSYNADISRFYKNGKVWDIDMTMDGTTVKVPYLPASDVNSYNQRYSIEVIAGEADDETAVRDILNGYYSAQPDGSRLFKETDDLSGSPFTIVKTDNEQYVEINLTKVGFVGNVYPVCTVKANLIVDVPGTTTSFTDKTKTYPVLAAAVIQDIHFSVTKLSAPANVAYANGVLSWDAVDGAEGYVVFDGDDRVGDVLINLSIDIHDMNLQEAGQHIFRVRALGNVGAALAANDLGNMTAYNASSRIMQVVALNYDIDGDVITKLVPLGSNIGDYLYEVKVPNKEFGGWFYDSGYSVKVNASDKLNGDITVYARLSDVKVTERKLTWWEQYKWYVLGPVIGLAAAGLIAGVIVSTKKSKKA